jgi:hypothetical protein
MPSSDWRSLVRDPQPGDHIVQVYQDVGFLAEAVTGYLQAGLDAGEAAVVIARPEHRARFTLEGEAVFLDAEETLGRLMANGMPKWDLFHELVGGLIAAQRRTHKAVRAYGEMVDILWQRGEREAATRLEEFWNDLAKLYGFSLFCAYYMDPLDSASYSGGMQCVCRTHTHLIPARDYARLDNAVIQASRKVLDHALAQMLLSLSVAHRPATHMPVGQATLLWLKQNMPRTADRVLSEVRASFA